MIALAAMCRGSPSSYRNHFSRQAGCEAYKDFLQTRITRDVGAFKGRWKQVDVVSPSRLMRGLCQPVGSMRQPVQAARGQLGVHQRQRLLDGHNACKCGCSRLPPLRPLPCMQWNEPLNCPSLLHKCRLWNTTLKDAFRQGGRDAGSVKQQRRQTQQRSSIAPSHAPGACMAARQSNAKRLGSDMHDPSEGGGARPPAGIGTLH